MDRENLLNKKEVKERGWTDKLIETFLGEPDESRTNPFYKKAAPTKLYDMDRIQEIEATEVFQYEFEKSRKRKSQAEKATITKKVKAEQEYDKILEELAGLELPDLTENELLDLAIKDYNAMWAGYEFKRACKNDDLDFLYRITVNFVRHNLINYEEVLTQAKNKTGKIDLLKNAYNLIFKKIGKKYPWLEAECDEQLYKKIEAIEGLHDLY